jgi:hypothetical protein
MQYKVISGIMFVLFFTSILTPTFRIQTVKADGTETYYYSFSRSLTWKTYIEDVVLNWTDVINRHTHSHGPYPLICGFNITFSSPDLNGVKNLTVPKESYYFEPVYMPPPNNLTWSTELVSDSYGRMYTQANGDVDIISMTNDTGTYFWKDDAWHPAGEEWIGDGTPDPAGSSWLHSLLNITFYDGEGTEGRLYDHHTLDMYFTTGFMNSTIDEPNSWLNCSCMSGSGFPFDANNNTVTYVCAGAKNNITMTRNEQNKWVEDKQFVSELGGGAIPVSSGTLFSPANLYITDPLGQSIGTHPNGTIVIPQIPDSFYTGPSSEPERIIIPNPTNGTYEVLITGTGNGTYGFMVDFAFSLNITERTKDVYYGSIVGGGVLWTTVIVSGKDVRSYTPVSTVGDINQDALVDIVDIVTCALAYGSETRDNPETSWDETEDWNPLTDLDLNEIIDIVDLVKIAIHFGETV